jgi:hypothetical protein
MPYPAALRRSDQLPVFPYVGQHQDFPMLLMRIIRIAISDLLPKKQIYVAGQMKNINE